MNKRIVIIGGVAAGTKSAAKARRQDTNADITIYTDEEFISYAGCGQPYYIGGSILIKDNLLARKPEQFEDATNINIKVKHRVSAIDTSSKTVDVINLDSNETQNVAYDALVIATGASPIIPPLPGVDLPGVYAVRTIPDAEEMRNLLDTFKTKNVVVVGGGYIGLEMVENLAARNLNVTVVEREDQLVPLFDKDVAGHVRNTLLPKRVTIMTGKSLEAINGTAEDGVQSVVIAGKTFPTDMVILSIGVRPNTKLAQEAGIELGVTGAIKVNQKMETSAPDVYAAGDCVETINLVTGKPAWIPLGSTANKQGRVVGTNITGGDAKFPGVYGTGIFRIFDLNVSKTGLSEKEAKKEGIDYEAVIVPADDKPHYMSGIQKVIIKLLAERSTRRLIGAEVWGRGNVDKVIDTIATALHFKATVEDAIQLDLAYAPPYAPAMGNFITAANVLQNKLDGNTKGILPLEVQEKVDRGDDFLMIDVSPPEMRAQICLKECINIPSGMLVTRLDEIPKDKEIITSCMLGLNAAQAYRILRDNGFENVRYMDGGLTAWPDPIPCPITKQ